MSRLSQFHCNHPWASDPFSSALSFAYFLLDALVSVFLPTSVLALDLVYLVVRMSLVVFHWIPLGWSRPARSHSVMPLLLDIRISIAPNRLIRPRLPIRVSYFEHPEAVLHFPLSEFKEFLLYGTNLLMFIHAQSFP